MKRNKGFTLIELLAVIVILAIIALIATPMILGVIETAKKGASESSALGYIDAIEKEIAINEVDSNKDNIEDGIHNLPLDTIKIKGNNPTSGWVVIDDGKVIGYSMLIEDYVVSYDSKTKSNVSNKSDKALDKPKCKRATELHKSICVYSDDTYYCSGAGYTENGSKKTNIITYGNESTTMGQLESGDAFDCDVNGDGLYDSKTERFYYVTDMDSSNDEENETAVLIYYSNVSGGTPDSVSRFAYNESGENWNGPVTAIKQLPTNEQWKNVALANTERKILNEDGESKTDSGNQTIVDNFSYKGYAARLLTTQELEKACNIKIGSYVTGELDSCNYLMELSGYSDGLLSMSILLENPSSYWYRGLWRILGNWRNVNDYDAPANGTFGIRPVIEVNKNDILY